MAPTMATKLLSTGGGRAAQCGRTRGCSRARGERERERDAVLCAHAGLFPLGRRKTLATTTTTIVAWRRRAGESERKLRCRAYEEEREENSSSNGSSSSSTETGTSSTSRSNGQKDRNGKREREREREMPERLTILFPFSSSSSSSSSSSVEYSERKGRREEETERVPLSQRTFLTTESRIVAIGDLHGDLQKTVSALKLAGVLDISESGAPLWCGGDTVIVQVGDLLDRGDHEIQILHLFLRYGDVFQSSNSNEICSQFFLLQTLSHSPFPSFFPSFFPW